MEDREYKVYDNRRKKRCQADLFSDRQTSTTTSIKIKYKIELLNPFKRKYDSSQAK
jgi:hypothetical protein